MKTNAEKQFDADYIILRHLFLSCRKTESVERMKVRIRHLAIVALHEIDKELHTEKFAKRMRTQSIYEQNEMNWIKENFDE